MSILRLTAMFLFTGRTHLPSFRNDGTADNTSIITSYECPSELISIFLDACLFKESEAPMFTYRYFHVRYNLALVDIALNGFRLDIHHLCESNLRDHVFCFILPIKEVNGFKTGHMNGIIDKYLWLLPLPKHILIKLNSVLCTQN